MADHYTDEHQTKRGSSVDIIERCAAFLRQCGDFEGILDYAQEGGESKPHTMLAALQKEAMRIINVESRSY